MSASVAFCAAPNPHQRAGGQARRVFAAAGLLGVQRDGGQQQVEADGAAEQGDEAHQQGPGHQRRTGGTGFLRLGVDRRGPPATVPGAAAARLQHVGSAHFACPAGVRKPGEWWGQALFG
ncbi:hypothetical protein ACWC9T_34550 [Kitasatospora sp. NPDC001159]